MSDNQKIIIGFSAAILVISLASFTSFNNSRAAVTATLALSPASGSYEVGQTFDVAVNLNTGENSSGGAEVYITYDTSLLEVQDSNTSTAGTQIQAGSLYSQTMTNSVSSGRISFSQVNSAATFYSGSGTFATISFRALTAGTAALTIDHTLGSTTDSNIEGEEGDILSSVTNASFTLAQPVDSTAPTISSVSSSSVTTSDATISWTTNEASTSQVEYGTTTDYGSNTTLDSNQATSHSVSLSSLSQGTTYHYRVKSQDAAGNLATSGDNTLTTTTPPDTTAPVISGVQVIAKDSSAAVIAWTTNEDSTSQIEYGGSASYGSSTSLDSSKTTSHQVSIGGLNANTTYHYRVKSQDVAGNLSVSDDNTFITDAAPPADTTAPSISNVRVISKDSSAAVIGWTTNEMSTSQIEYGISASYGTATSLNKNRILDHQVSIGSLKANTLYHYRVISKDAAGNEAKSNDSTFTTTTTESKEQSIDTIAPSIVTGLNVITDKDKKTITLNWVNPLDKDFVKVVVVRNDNKEPSGVSDGTVIYEGAGTNFIDSNVTAGTIYYYKIFTADSVPNYSEGTSVSASIQQATKKIQSSSILVKDFKAETKGKKVELSWSSPAVENFDKVIIRKREDNTPKNSKDGELIYVGKGEKAVDPNVEAGKTYYYSAFSVDKKGGHSKPVSAIVIVKAPVVNILPGLLITLLLLGGGVSYWRFFYKSQISMAKKG